MLNAAAAMLVTTGAVGGLLAVARSETTDVRGEPNSAWLAGGQRGLVLLGSVGSNRPSFGVRLGGAAEFDVVDAGERIVAVDRATGQATELDGATGKQVRQFRAPIPGDSRPTIVAAGDRLYAVDLAAQSAREVTSATADGEMLAIDGGFTDWIGSRDGRLWMTDADDGDIVIFDGESVNRAGMTDRRADLHLTVLGDDPVVLDRSAGKLRWPRRSESIDLGNALVVVQEPAPASVCATVLLPNEVQCLDAKGVVRSMPIAVADPTGAQLFASESTVVVSWPDRPDMVVADWRSGQTAKASRLTPSGRRLVSRQAIGKILVDDPGSGYAVTVDGTTLVEMEKFSKETVIVSTDGQTTGGVAEADDEAAVQALGLGGEGEDELSRDNNGRNDPPRAINDRVTARAGANVDVGVLANDFDPDADRLTVSDVGAVEGPGTAEIVNGEFIVYAAPEGAGGDVTFEYTVVDPGGLSSSAVVTVNVIAGDFNSDPTATDDDVTTKLGESVQVEALANDGDPEGDDLVISDVTNPSHGSVAWLSDSITYTPDAGFIGADSFQYFVTDGRGGQARASVRIEVVADDGGNAPPEAADDSYSLVAGSNRRVDVLDNDDDPDGDPLVVQPLDDVDGLTLTLLPDGAIDVRAANRAAGVKTFTYAVRDPAGLEDTAQVTVSIQAEIGNRAPIARDDIASAVVGQPVVIPVANNDFDPDDDPLLIVNVGAPDIGGTVSELTNDPGSIRFVPPFDARPDQLVTFTYRVEDPLGLSSTATVRVIIVAPTGSDPIANPDTATVFPGQAAAIDVVANDVHPDGLPLAIIGQPSSPYPSSAFAVGDRVITFTPPDATPATYTYRYTIGDVNGRTATATVTVTVQERPITNGPPVPQADTAQTERGQAVMIDVLLNDRDPDSDALAIVAVGQPVRDGEATISAGRVRYVPAAGFVGQDSFTYSVSDGINAPVEETVAVRVTPPATVPPSTSDDLLSIIVDTDPAVIDPVANDTDPDGVLLRLQSFSVDPALSVTRIAGTNSLRVSSGTVGRFRISYSIADADDLTASGEITVSVALPPNTPPEARNDAPGAILPVESASIDVLSNDFDPDGGSFEIADFTQPTSAAGDPGSVSQSGDSLVFAPNSDFAGEATFTYRIVDPRGELSSPATVTITVNPCPAVPVLSDRSETTPFQTSVTTAVFGRGGARPEGTLSVQDPIDQPGSVRITDDVRGRVRYEPPAGFSGRVEYLFMLTTACGAQVTATVTVTVNVPPDAVDDTETTLRNSSVDVDVMRNDSAGGDEGDRLTLTGATAVSGGTVQIVAGKVRFTPTPNSSADGVFTYTIEDIGGQQATATVRVTVGNTAPVANDEVFGRVQPGDTIPHNVVANDNDANGDPLTVVGTPVVNPSGAGTATVTAPGTVNFTAAAGAGGDVRITYTVSDDVDTATATWTVRVNQAPTALPVSDRDSEVGLVAIDVTQGNVADPDGDTVALVTSGLDAPQVTSGSGTIAQAFSDGRIEFLPGASGTIEIRFTVTDGFLTASSTATLTIEPNLGPTAQDAFATTTGTAAVTFDLIALTSDPEGQALQFFVGSHPDLSVSEVGGIVTVSSILGTPGSFSITYTVNDSAGASASATLTIQVV